MLQRRLETQIEQSTEYCFYKPQIHQCFQDAYKLFYTGCILPILGYGAELYDHESVVKLENIRLQSIKPLHFMIYRYAELKYEYLNMTLFHQINLPALNKQLVNLGIDEIESFNLTKKQIFRLNKQRVIDKWNNQNEFRASNFKTSDLHVRLAIAKKTPSHLRKALEAFLTG